ncbi:MAG: potassium-transporting ATPase subunit KdpC [Candidatus Sericytochromatia bacterium]
MLSNFITSIKMFLVMTIITGVIYPVSVWALSQTLFNEKANGSLIMKENKVIGSKLIGQSFTQDKYFQGRLSAVNYSITSKEDYDKGNYVYTSGGTNFGPTNKKLKESIEDSIKNLKDKNQNNDKIPLELVTLSASGLDPDISVKAALWQVPRIAKVRNIYQDKLREIILNNTEKPFLGFIGDERVNVLLLNIELDKLN